MVESAPPLMKIELPTFSFSGTINTPFLSNPVVTSNSRLGEKARDQVRRAR